MSDTSAFGFARLVPGFDFLHNLTQGAAAGMPPLSQWVAPTMSVQEIERRIQEFKAVQFWLEQNARALAATVQALEVQRMTLATLQDMNLAVGDMAAAMAGAAAPAAHGAKTKADTKGRSQPSPRSGPSEQSADPAPAAAAAGSVDPVQWWGALTQQFQRIAAQAVQDAQPSQAAFAASQDMAQQAMKTVGEMASQWTAQAMQAATPQRGTAAAAPTAPRSKAKPASAARKSAPARGKRAT